ncbi:MAG TPA: tetratricopeptide repeat protein, partial [Pyrinomonadaceae bacterium]|nr:tetratricopeptide repeat protein [Pyrinomonadaceae bacterium]
ELHDFQGARERLKELESDATSASATLLLEHIKLAEEIESLKQKLQADSGDADAHFRMGNAYFQWHERYRSASSKTHFVEAIEQYQETIRLAPDLPEAHLNLGLAYLEQGDKNAAMEQYQALQRLKSSLADQLWAEINKR